MSVGEGTLDDADCASGWLEVRSRYPPPSLGTGVSVRAEKLGDADDADCAGAEARRWHGPRQQARKKNGAGSNGREMVLPPPDQDGPYAMEGEATLVLASGRGRRRGRGGGVGPAPQAWWGPGCPWRSRWVPVA